MDGFVDQVRERNLTFKHKVGTKIVYDPQSPTKIEFHCVLKFEFEDGKLKIPKARI